MTISTPGALGSWQKITGKSKKIIGTFVEGQSTLNIENPLKTLSFLASAQWVLSLHVKIIEIGNKKFFEINFWGALSKSCEKKAYSNSRASLINQKNRKITSKTQLLYFITWFDSIFDADSKNQNLTSRFNSVTEISDCEGLRGLRKISKSKSPSERLCNFFHLQTLKFFQKRLGSWLPGKDAE
jgi:hypothetical protein